MNVIKERYEGIQTAFRQCGEDGCHFLVLCSIADEWRQEHGLPFIDIIETIHLLRNMNLITADYYVRDNGCKVLSILTENKKWTRKDVDKLPRIRDNDYTEVVYFNPRTQFHHFRRRGYDTLSYSATVKEGYIESYRIYTVEQ